MPPSTIERIVDSFPVNEQAQIRAMLTGSLEAIIAQRLLRKKGGGRVATFEIMVPDAGIRHNIREGQTFKIYSSMQTGKAKGNILMDNHLYELAVKGLVEPEDALALAQDYGTLEKKFKEANLIGFGEDNGGRCEKELVTLSKKTIQPRTRSGTFGAFLHTDQLHNLVEFKYIFVSNTAMFKQTNP